MCSSFCTTTVLDSADGSGSPTSAPFRGSWSRHSSDCVERRFRHSAQDEPTPACTREVRRSVCTFPSAGIPCECDAHSTRSCPTTYGSLPPSRCVRSFMPATAPSRGAIVTTSVRTTKHGRRFDGHVSIRSTGRLIERSSIKRHRCLKAITAFAPSLCSERRLLTTIIAAPFERLDGMTGLVGCYSKSRRIAFCITWCDFSSAR